MKLVVTALALAVGALPFLAATPSANAQGYSQERVVVKQKKVKKAKSAKKVVRQGSPYSTNPAHDVYVNGNYAGSDPDPRVRWTIRKEYCEDSLDGC